MKKNLIAGVVFSLVMTGFFGGVSFAAEAVAPAKAEVKTEAKAVAPVEKKKATKKKVAKKVEAKKVEVKKAEAKTEAAGK